MSDIKTYDCNKCGRSSCNGDVVRGPKRSFKHFVKCPGHVGLPDMKVSLLERASEHDGWIKNISPVLVKLKMSFVETPKYPGFRFKIH